MFCCQNKYLKKLQFVMIINTCKVFYMGTSKKQIKSNEMILIFKINKNYWDHCIKKNMPA